MAWSLLAKKVHHNLIRTSLLQPNDRILLACSGGLDSVALVHVLLELKTFWNWDLFLGHIDHGFRPEEDKEESEFCHKLAAENNLPYLEDALSLSGIITDKKKLQLMEKKYALSFSQNRSEESLARDMRYAVLEAWRQGNHCDHIVTAHHRDDQVETLVYRFLTGSGLRGLTGIHEKRNMISRPLLSVSKKELKEYVQQNGISYMEDSSNSNRKYARNRIRHDVLPFLRNAGFPDMDKNISRLSGVMAQYREFMDAHLQKKEKELLIISGQKISLDLQGFNGETEFFRKEFLAYIFKEHAGSRHLSQSELANCVEFLAKGITGDRLSVSQWYISIDRATAVISSEEFKKPYEEFYLTDKTEVEVPEFGTLKLTVKSHPVEISDRDSLFLPIELLKKKCILRAWKSGETMTLFGKGQTKKVSDILKDEHLSVNLKTVYPVLEIDGEIVWIPGIKRSSYFPVIEWNNVIEIKTKSWRE